MQDNPDSPLSRSERTARRWFRVLALILAVSAWVVTREAISLETIIYDIPVTFLMDPGWAVLDHSDSSVDIRFRGSRGDLAGLKRDDIKVTVDVRKARESRARQVISLRPSNVRAPGSVRPVLIEPAQITLSMDREGEVEVPVRAELQDRPPEGFETGGFLCTPAIVKLRGPLSKLQDIETLSTAPIGLEGRTRSFTTRVAVPAPAAWSGARIEPDRVDVAVTIVEHAGTRVFEQVPVRLMSRPGASGRERVSVSPSRVNVSLQGREEILHNLGADSVRAFVDCAAVSSSGTYELPVHLVLPPGVRSLSVEPASVKMVLP